jgi:predicted aminopeptidase
VARRPGHRRRQLRAQLRLAQRLRRFAVTDLALPDNASYRRYVELTRRGRGVERGGGARRRRWSSGAGASR